MVHSFEEDDEAALEAETSGKRITDFDCPSCNANNPVEESIRDGAELLCNYCGEEFRAKVSGEGRLRLKEL